MADDDPQAAPAAMFNIKSAARFLSASALSFVLNPGLSALLHEVIGVPVRWAYAIALVVVFIVNFLLLRYVVYGRTKGSASGQLVGFVVGTLCFRVAEYAVFLALSSFTQIHYLVSIVGISAVFTVLKYLVYGSTIFRSRDR